MSPEFSIVVPLYNEEENIEELYARLTQVLRELRKGYELILVTNACTVKFVAPDVGAVTALVGKSLENV